MADRKMGPRETALLANAQALVEFGKELDAKGEAPYFYYEKAANLRKEFPKALLADALEEAIGEIHRLEEQASRRSDDSTLVARLRAVLAEVDRG